MVDATVLLVLRIMTALSSLMVSLSPALSIYKIYQNKTIGNISVVPFVSLLGNAHMWCLYGYFCGNIFNRKTIPRLFSRYMASDSNWFMFIPNAICVVLGFVLLVLYVKYRPSKAAQRTVELPDDDIAIQIVISPKSEMQGKVASASPSFQPMASPLRPLSRENSFQLSSPSRSRGSSFQQLSSPAFSTRSGSFHLGRSESFERGATGGVLHIVRAPRQ